MRRLMMTLVLLVTVALQLFPWVQTMALAQERGLTRAQSAEIFADKKKYAVIVGVNNYIDNTISNLEYAVNDAKCMAEFFEWQGYEVELLVGSEANNDEIKARLESFTSESSKAEPIRGSLVFAFSGHGFQHNKKNYLATPGTKRDDLDDTALAIDTVTAILEQTKFRQRVLFIDACRNDASKSVYDKEQTFSEDKASEGLAILYSTKANSLSWEDEGLGVFTRYLLEGLQGKAASDDGLVTFDRLSRYVVDPVKRHVREKFGKEQIPYIGGERTGEFVLAKVNPLRVVPDSFKQNYEPDMVNIGSGSFSMGDLTGDGLYEEQPVHNVQIGSFRMSKHEITFEQYDIYVESAGVKKPADKGWGRGKRPVVNVNWYDVQGYIHWLNQQTGKHFRLPTESEWEYVARAGSKTKYHWGNDSGNNRADCEGCKGPWDDRQTAPVGSFAPNAWGLYDMHGNVKEWVEDNWHDHYEGAPTDGSAWIDGGNASHRVLRGGSWDSVPWGIRSAYRSDGYAGKRMDNVGFRLAQDMPEQLTCYYLQSKEN